MCKNKRKGKFIVNLLLFNLLINLFIFIELTEYLQKGNYSSTDYTASALRDAQQLNQISNREVDKNKETFDKITVIIQNPKNSKFYNKILLYNV
jgi:hypothetical protein